MTPIAQMSLYEYVSLTGSCAERGHLHWLSVSGLLENFGSHVAWRPAGSGEDEGRHCLQEFGKGDFRV
jgi:hypothetical protein